MHLAAQGLTAKGWSLRWDNSRRRAGCCRYRYRVISLSTPLMSAWTIEQARQTILHEIAHALTPGDHHGPAWARKCRELGIEPNRSCATPHEARAPLTS